MNILALDLGTHMGIAVNKEKEVFCNTVTLGTKKEISNWHKTRMDRRSDPRIERCFDCVQEHIRRFCIDVVVFEDVQFQSYTLQTQLWSSYRAAVWLAARGRIIECIPTNTLKLFATGYGGANKELMLKYLKKRHPGQVKLGMDDNAVDATWLWLWAQEKLSRIPLPRR